MTERTVSSDAGELEADELDKGELEAGFTLIELMVVLLIIAILLAIAIPTFLGVANSASDRSAQSNLTNALTEAKALYQNNASYDSAGVAMTPATFSASAPEFSWTTGACSGASSANCVSMQVVDGSTVNDGQGIVLAVYSPKSQNCWYAVDLEATASTFTDTSPAVAFITAGQVPTGATTAGVFYAKKSLETTPITASTYCSASWAVTTNGFAWGASYSNAGAAA